MGFSAPANGGYFATPTYAATMFFSFVAGMFLTVACSRLGGFGATTQMLMGPDAGAAAARVARGVAANAQVLERTKMALVVRRDLKMGSGKVAAQCAHAAVGVIDEIYDERDKEERKRRNAWVGAAWKPSATTTGDASAAPPAGAAAAAAASSAAPTDAAAAPSVADEWVTWLEAWRGAGSAKVVLQVETEADLMDIVDKARMAKLPVTYIRDAGRTQIAAGSKTVAAVGPAPASRVDAITGSLKLL